MKILRAKFTLKYSPRPNGVYLLAVWCMGSSQQRVAPCHTSSTPPGMQRCVRCCTTRPPSSSSAASVWTVSRFCYPEEYEYKKYIWLHLINTHLRVMRDYSSRRPLFFPWLLITHTPPHPLSERHRGETSHWWWLICTDSMWLVII